MKTKAKRLRRSESKIGDSVFLIIQHDDPIYFIHGAYSTESKVYAAMRDLEKLPENRLTRKQKLHNKKYQKSKEKPLFVDPMNAYMIREVTIE